ncbi:tumor necrosis factor ligand superfamily member 12 [Mustelus asterias]
MGQGGGMVVARRLKWKLRLPLLVLLTALAMSLATLSLAVTALTWGECRSLSQALQQQGDKPTLLEGISPDMTRDSGKPGMRLSFLQGLVESKRLTRIRRERGRVSGSKNKQPMAAHFEVIPNNNAGTYTVERDGLIKQWSECPLQTRNTLSYNNRTGEFVVLKDGLYYMYSQVHCDDNTTAYLKLEVLVDNVVILKCVQGLPPTPLYSQQLAVHSCQASGLVQLRKKSQIKILSIAGVHLKTKTFAYFGLFKLCVVEVWPELMVSPVSAGMAALAGVLLCLAAQVLQSAEMARLRWELEGLREECGARRTTDESQDESPALARTRAPGYTSPAPQLRDCPQPARTRHREPERQALRVERDSEGRRRQRSERKNSLIHLVPSSYQSEGDSTIIHWQKILHTGESFEQNNSTIAIKRNGYYLIYTQVLYQDTTFVMGHVVKRREQRKQKEGETLLRCTQNMPAKQPFNTCYSAGIYRLQKGDIIELLIPRNSANIVMESDSTYMGLMKV